MEEIEIGKLTRPPLMLREGGQETLTLVSPSVSDVPRQDRDGPDAPGPASLQPPLADAAPEELPPPLPANNSISSEPPGFESASRPVSVPSPVSLPPYVNGCRHGQTHAMLQPSQDFDGDIIGDDLDKLLDQAEPEVAMVSTECVCGGGNSKKRRCTCDRGV